MRHDRSMEAMTLRPSTLTGITIRVAIDEQSQIGAARRAAVALANENSLSGEAIGRLAIIVTEAATNVLIHGHGGALLLRAISICTPDADVMARRRSAPPWP